MNRRWLTVFALVFIWSAIRPADIFTWFLEVVPAMIGLVILREHVLGKKRQVF